MKKIPRQTVWPIAAIIVFSIMAGILAYLYGYNHIDSDSSAEMILAKILAEDNHILSQRWCYSTEIRLLDPPVFTSLFFRLFTSWRVVRACSTVVMSLIIGMCFYAFGKYAGIAERGLVFIPAITLPLSGMYQEFVIQGMYYVPRIAVIMITLGLVFSLFSKLEPKEKSTEQKPDERTLDRERLYRGIKYAVLFLLAFLTGMGGSRQMVILYVPLLLSVLYILIMEYCAVKRMIYPYVKLSLALLAASAAGYVINTKVLSQFYRFSRGFDDLIFRNFEMSNLDDTINAVLSFFGWMGKRNLSSLGGLSNLCVLFLIAAFMYIMIRMLRNIKELSLTRQIVLLFFCFSLMINVVIFVMTEFYFYERYVLLFLILYLGIFAMYFTDCNWGELKNKVLYYGIIIAILLNTAATAKAFAVNNDNIYKQDAARYLVSEGYDYGYASFWNANVLTELSNGGIEVCILEKWDTFKVNDWLMKVEFIEKESEEKVFLLIDEKEEETVLEYPYASEKFLVYENAEYKVYSYENTKLLKDMFEDAAGPALAEE